MMTWAYLWLCSGKTGGFVRTIIYTSVTFLALQCFMQIPFAYISLSGKAQTPHYYYQLMINLHLSPSPFNTKLNLVEGVALKHTCPSQKNL